MINKILTASALWFYVATTIAQEIGIGQWREHPSYRRAYTLTEGGNKIYCTSKNGIFSINQSDNSVEQLSKTTGLSDVAASALGFNKYNNTLVIAYENSNIDLIQGNSITNLSDINRKSILGNKSINNISFINQYAYLACGFGIVVVNTDKKEITDTYYIGANGTPINVYAITGNGTDIYAATEKGIYTASLSNPNLADFSNWTKMTGIPTGIYNTITSFNGKIYTNFSALLTYSTNNWLRDTLFVYNGNSWEKRPGYYVIKNISASSDYLLVTKIYTIELLDKSDNIIKNVASYGPGNPDVRPSQSIIDKNGLIWVADQEKGLFKVYDNKNAENIFASGPASQNVVAISVQDNKVAIVPGGRDGSFGSLYNTEGISFNNQGIWTYIRGKHSVASMDTLFDYNNIVIDPQNKEHIYAGSWNGGVSEFYNDTLYKVWNAGNSTLSHNPLYYAIRIGGMTFDKDGNLWVSNSHCPRTISVRKADGTWKGVDFSSLGITVDITSGPIIATKSRQKWVILPRNNGLLVYNDDGTIPAANASNSKRLNNNPGSGGLPSNNIFSIAEDESGAIWVGTDKGVVVFYSPENIFKNSSGWDASEVLLEQDGHIQKLLETETVSAIAIDAANRKWFGTQRSGVFLMSADGTKQLHHFTAENSPLLSNNITSIAINHQTGEIYFGTGNGLVSYKGTATESYEQFTDVTVYPNPIKPDYTGLIAIKGLVKNTNVKITDVAGNLVYSIKAEGGQAIWNGTNFSGERVQTGVYLVFCSNEDGSQTYVTKLLFIN